MKNPRGRPKKAPDELQTAEVTLNATEALAAAIKSAASARGLSASAWLSLAAAEALRAQGVKIEPATKRRPLRAV
jgi:hypothetical protein